MTSSKLLLLLFWVLAKILPPYFPLSLYPIKLKFDLDTSRVPDSIWQANIYLFTGAKTQWGLLKFEVRSLKFQFRMAAKNSYAKFQSVCHNKNNPTKIEMAVTKTHKTWPKYYCYLKSHNSCLVLFILSRRGVRFIILAAPDIVLFKISDDMNRCDAMKYKQ